MASRVAHEIRNPLGVMSVHAELLGRELGPDADPAEARSHLGVIRGEIRSVADLVEAYLRFGRLPKPAPEPVDLDGLVDARLDAIGVEVAADSITLQRERGEALPAVHADPARIAQVVTNLLRNAVEAMSDGGTLTVTTGTAGDRVAIEVADTGPGVAAADGERVFEPFHTTKTTGTGLGLALAREIVQGHGGTLTCRSRPDGATFVLDLPVRKGEAP